MLKVLEILSVTTVIRSKNVPFFSLRRCSPFFYNMTCIGTTNETFEQGKAKNST